MARFTDLMEMKNDPTRGNAIRERLAKIIYDTLVKEFGEDDTLLLSKKITVFESDIPANTVCVDVGDVLDNDKATVGAVAEISVKVKSWNTVATKRGTRYAVTLDDIKIALDEPEDS